jgi:hypothetical protein
VRRCTLLGLNGAPSPSGPRSARVKSPLERQVQLWQEPRHLRRAALKERQDPTLEARIETMHERAAHRDRPVHQRHVARLSEAIVVDNGGLGRPACMTAATQEVVDFFFDDALQAGLHVLTNKRLQRRLGQA